MVTWQEPFREPLDDLSDEQWIPIISIGFIVIAYILSGFRYYFNDQAMMLLFSAVLVRVWTQVGSDLPLAPNRNSAYISFNLMTIGTVSIGITMEQLAYWITCDLITVQSLVLAVVISRLYINIRDGNVTTWRDVVRYKEPVDRYLVLVPTGIAFLVSALFYQLEVYLYRRETT